MTALPLAPGPDDFRALARSSPWRFGSLHFTHRSSGTEPAEAWLSRPGHLEVLFRGKRHVETGVPYSRSALFGWDGGGKPVQPVHVPTVAPQEVEPRRRSDGLVEKRPDAVGIDYDDPMWENYRWVAMLDPVELSHGVDVGAVEAHRRLGRETWTATCRARPGEEDGYNPRCSCCPLLYGEVSQALDFNDSAEVARRRPPLGYPSSYRVSLDVETGVVVEVLPCDGDDSGSTFSNEIHAVGPLG
ncbi:hypothetical protein [Tessaracoccus terricola]